MIIRQETTSDASAVYELVKTAFASAEHSDGNEQDLVVLLHKAPLSNLLFLWWQRKTKK